MTTTQRQKWEKVRAKGHARYIMRSFLYWGLPMWAAQILGPFFYDAITHKAYVKPLQVFPSPVWSFIFDLAFWILGFGWLMGEANWQSYEKDYHKDDRVA